MALIQTSTAAATAVVDYNLLSNHPARQSNRPRTLAYAGVKGSAAALDTLVRILIGTRRLADLYNTGTGMANRDDMFQINATVAANEEISAIIVDAPSTNPINLVLDVRGG